MNTVNFRTALLLLLALGGCAHEGAIFVTKSSLSIFDVDSTPAEATVALQRVEGFFAPRNRNGDTPPVLAHLQANRAFFSPEVQQVYATGTAAERLAGDETSDNSACSDCEDTKDAPPVTFATSTTFGLRVGLSGSTSIIEGVVLGYRRKEMSFVPALAKGADGTYHYPSLIAAIKLNEQEDGKTEFRSCQGFATGSAATALAQRDEAGFGCLGNQTVRQLLVAKAGSSTRQQAEIAKVLSCYINASEERKAAMRADAQRLGLLVEARSQEAMLPVAQLEAKTAPLGSGRADTDYARRLLAAVDEATHPTAASIREQLLRIHRNLACGEKS